MQRYKSVSTGSKTISESRSRTVAPGKFTEEQVKKLYELTGREYKGPFRTLNEKNESNTKKESIKKQPRSRIRGKKREKLIEDFKAGKVNDEYNIIPTKTEGKYIFRPKKDSEELKNTDKPAKTKSKPTKIEIVESESITKPSPDTRDITLVLDERDIFIWKIAEILYHCDMNKRIIFNLKNGNKPYYENDWEFIKKNMQGDYLVCLKDGEALLEVDTLAKLSKTENGFSSSVKY